MHHSIGVYHVFIVCRTGLRSICILLPILGITWVFGVFAVNEGTVVFQYLFAICNSLQVCFRTEQNRTEHNIYSVLIPVHKPHRRVNVKTIIKYI